MNEKYVVNSAEFASKGKATPFDGWDLYGQCILTMCDGKIVYRKDGKGTVDG